MFLRPSSTNLRQAAVRFGGVCKFASVLILGILVSGHIQSSRAAATDAQAGGLVTLRGNTRAEATAPNDRGRVSDDMTLNHMMLLLHRPSEQEQALQQFIKDLHDPASPRFHHWITAAEFGERYGVSAAGISSVTNWLESQGFTVNLAYPSQMLIDFTGSAGQVRQAFHTEIHHLVVRGEAHIANMSDPQIPAELAPVVSGIVSLNDFRPRPTLKQRPSYTVSSAYQLVVPADLATIYNFTPAFTAGISGQGQTIVLIEDTDLYSAADWSTFRSTLGLASAYPNGTLAQVHPASTPTNNCADPGVNGDDAEAAIDVEWSSAGAPSAAIELASCANTETTWGAWVALQNLLNGSGQPPSIVSISYGSSESNYGSGGNAYISSLYQQAVTEGVSVFVSSGDEGAASTDYDAAYAASGINVSGFTSTPYNVSVGGTDFADAYEQANGTYWSNRNSANYGSALSYVPEIPWNDSCAGVLLADYLGVLPTYGSGSLCNTSTHYLDDAAGSGGPSGCATGAPTISGVVSGTCAGYPKPSWQSGITGNPHDGVRDVPDVSLFAANGLWGHYYVVCYSDPNYGGASCSGAPDTWAGFGGTSVASPIMAAIQSLANQASGSRWGNPNPTYYALAAAQFSSGGAASCDSALGNAVSSNCIFYDITQIPLLYTNLSGTGGDNDVPCLGVNCYAPSGTYGVLSTAPQSLTSAWVTGLGSGYTSAPTCTLSGGGGSGAACSAIRTGVVNSISLTSGGGGYTSWPTCTLTGGGGTGASCTAFACTNGEACYPELTNFGSGYTSAPTCTISGGGGSGATCSVTEALGIAVSLTAPGSGYTALPNCVLTGGGGSGAMCAATATNTSNSYQPAFGATTGWDFATGIGSVNASNLVSSFSSGVVNFSPLALSFPSQILNTTSTPLTLTVTNTGASSLSIYTVAIGGTDPGDFAKTNADYCTGANLSTNSTCTVDVTFTPSAAGSRSASLLFTDSAPGSPQTVKLSGTGLNPVPNISSLSPSSATAGAAAQTLTINGTNFVAASTVTYKGVGHTAAFVSSEELTITLSASDQATAGTYAVVVTNPAPGGGASNSVSFIVGNPVPSITSLSPASATVGAAAQTLTINGSGFMSSSTVTYNGTGHAATYVNATQLKITLSTGDQATAGVYAVVVTNPAPGGGASNSVNFTVNNPVPTLTSLSPASATAGAAATTLTITGTKFLATSTVSFNGVVHTTTYVSATQLKITLSTSDLATGGTYGVVVTNPTPGGGASNSVNFTVNNPVPTLTSLSPTSAMAGTTTQTLTLNGTNFLSNSTVTYHAVAHTPTFVSSTQLTITLNAGDLGTAGTFAVVVTNPAPGGGTSNTLDFTVDNLVPTIASLSPSSATAGAAAQTLTITGTNFLSNSTATYNGAAHTPTFLSSTQLTISLTASDQAKAGSYAVVVSNPAPGGGASNSLHFAVNNPVPSISSLSPASVTAGAAAQTMTINGANFVSTLTVTYNAVAHAVTYVSSTQLKITLSTGDQATAGIYAVVVTNPAPGGGASNSVNFTVNNPVPTLTSLSPASATAGAAATTLTITGTKFVSTLTVSFNGVVHTTTYVSATQLKITLSTSDLATGGTYGVVVTNPTPGGGASNSVNFTVNNPVPTLTSLSPTSAMAGTTTQTLTLNGTNFLSNSTVTYHAVAHTPTFVSSTQLTITLSASDLGTAGTYAVVVTNPTPGGGTSNTLNFTVDNLVPTIASLSPSSAMAGAAAQTLTINGTNFVSNSTVTYHAVAHTPTFLSSTQLTITLSASDQATAGNYAVVLTNPTRGGGASNSVTFVVSNGVPSITTLSPASVTAGAAAQTMTINGANFVSTLTVTYNAVAHAVTYVSSTQLKITLSASDQATAGIYAVVVTNPAPGGGASNSVNFTVNNPVPTLTSLSPASATAGAAATTVTITGTKFLATLTGSFNGVVHTTTYVSATQLKITLSTSDLATGGTYGVVVTNPAPGGGASNSVNFTVNNPVPALTSLSPTSAMAGTATQTLTLNGTNFLSNSTVTYHAVAHTPTFVSSTQLTITLSASDLTTGGTYGVAVTNPTPGGGTSSTLDFTVDNLVPTVTSLSPPSGTAGAAAQTLTINGTNFVSNSTVTYHAVAHTPTFLSSTQLTITLSASDQATAGNYAVVVTNPTPGGGASNSVTFVVSNGVPTITSLSPASATVGAASQAVTINGTGFVSTSTVTYNGAAHTATYVSSAQLKITLSATDLATAGTYPVVVTNPAPGGGASNAMSFTVGNPVPAITSISPGSATAGAAATTLTITGTKFLSTSTVSFNGVAHTTTYASATQLKITLSTSDLATAGIYAVVVTNPAPGGGASNSVYFTVNKP